MENDRKILIEEYNVISLRMVYVTEHDGYVSLQLLPAPSSMEKRPNVNKSEFFEWLQRYQIYLYEQTPSVATTLVRGVIQLAFESPPELKVIWTDSGNSVAVYLNGVPWALIDEHTNMAYSKGVIKYNLGPHWGREGPGNPWNQEVFEKTFADAGDES